jgi:hypothetical protein
MINLGFRIMTPHNIENALTLAQTRRHFCGIRVPICGGRGRNGTHEGAEKLLVVLGLLLGFASGVELEILSVHHMLPGFDPAG